MFDKVFISYAKEDYHFAEKLYNYLYENGFNPWLDFENEILKNDNVFFLNQLLVFHRNFLTRYDNVKINFLEDLDYHKSTFNNQICYFINQLDEEDRSMIFKMVDKMLTTKKFNDFFNKNLAAL